MMKIYYVLVLKTFITDLYSIKHHDFKTKTAENILQEQLRMRITG